MSTIFGEKELDQLNAEKILAVPGTNYHILLFKSKSRSRYSIIHKIHQDGKPCKKCFALCYKDTKEERDKLFSEIDLPRFKDLYQASR